jgi:hemoglobin-like flavoprotein
VDPRTIALVQNSFEKIKASGTAAAEIFYAELFAIDPSLRSMFGADMQIQHRKFLSAVHYLVYALHAPEKIMGSVEKLAQTHVQHGITAEHYTIFGIALLRALKKILAGDFNPDLCDAWANAYQIFVQSMRSAANARAPATEVQVAWWRSLLFEGRTDGYLSAYVFEGK